jgi:endonuclease/exonuclease/phosphatase family metal-dependent hydrolase
MTRLRIATFNLENWDDKPDEKPTLDERIAVMRPQLLRLNADILCLQEVNGQEVAGQPRQLLALQKLLADTPYANYHVVSSRTADKKQVFDERNLVILSRFEILNYQQYKHEFADAPLYRPVTAQPKITTSLEVTWERPLLHAQIRLPDGATLNVINLHLKSKLPADIPGQKLSERVWRSASGWAEGFFVASIKRVGQALEARILIDQLFDQDENALIVVGGDFNAEADEVPLEAICGELENTGNRQLANRVMVMCERSIPKSSRFSLLHKGQGRMLDHLLISRSLLAHYRDAEVHNELLHDESLASASDRLYPESDHAPVLARFEWPES